MFVPIGYEVSHFGGGFNINTTAGTIFVIHVTGHIRESHRRLSALIDLSEIIVVLQLNLRLYIIE